MHAGVKRGLQERPFDINRDIMEKSSASWIVVLLLLIIAGYCVGINAYIQEVDPATYAEVSREMVESHDYVYLHDNYREYLDKPPVTLWLIAASYLMFGVKNYAVRLPSFLMSLVALLSVYWLGALFWNKRAGLLSALLMASTAAFKLMIQDPKIDMVLIGFMTLSIALLYKGLSRPRYLWAGYIVMAVAFLTKGPISIGIPVLAFGSYALFKKDFGIIKRLRPVTGLLLTGVLVLPWYIAVALRRGDYTAYFMLFLQSFGRFYKRKFYYGGNPFFYIYTFAWAFLPWTVLFIMILVRRFTDWRKKIKPDEGSLFALWWWVLPFIILSIAISKLPHYIFWIIPPAALLTGKWLDDWFDTEAQGKEKKILIAQLIAAWIPPALTGLLFVVSFPPHTMVPWIVLGSGVLCMLAFSFSHMLLVRKAVVVSVLSMLTFGIIFSSYLYPSSLYYQPFQVFGKQIRDMSGGKKSIILSYRFGERGTLNYYSRMPVREVDTQPQIDRYLAKHNPSFFIAKEDQIPGLRVEGYSVKVIKTLPYYPTSRPHKCFVLKWDRDKCLMHLTIGIIAKKQAG